MDENLLRFKSVRNIILGLFVILILSSFRLQIIEGNKYVRLSEKNRIRKRYISAPRGKIFDRNNVQIANTRPGFYVSIIRAIADKSTLEEITRILNIKEESIQERFKMEKNPFMPVKIAHDISFEQLSLIEEHMDAFNGIEVGIEPLRNYLYGELLSHLIGYVGEVTYEELNNNDYKIGDYIGRMGLEEYYEKTLKGTHGIEYVEVDARGKEVGDITEKRPILIIPGRDLYATIDFALTESVAVYLKDYEKASCVCLDPINGEILVLYSKPGFDPNVFTHGLQKIEWDVLNRDPDAPMYNRTIMSCYPCGSAFKPFVALAALDAKMITKEKRFEPCLGEYRLGRRVFKCWKKHGSLNLTGAIINSCDIYFYQLGRFIGIDTIFSRVNKMGFGRNTEVDLPNEKCGLLPERKFLSKRYGENWTEGHIFNLSIGQGDLLATPLQLACAYTLFINDGKIPTPHIIKREKISYRETNMSKEVIEIVKQALAGVVATGTGTLARVKNFEVCGKTGTIQNPHGDDHSVFVGFAPASSPRILVCVFVENAGHGGSVAAPITGKIISAYLNGLTAKNLAEDVRPENHIQKN